MQTHGNLSRTGAWLILTLAAGCSSGSGSTGGTTDGGTPDDVSARKDTLSSIDAHGRSDSGKPSKEASTPDGNKTDGTSSMDAESDVAPTVLSTTPVEGAIGVAINAHVAAMFSEPMSPATLSAATFTLTTGDASAPIAGSVVYASSEAVFWPTAALASSTTYDAKITTGATGANGLALAANYTWSFTTGSNIAAGVPVDLGEASQYVVLAETAISTVSPSTITGDIAVSPAAATYITGFSLIADPSNVFSTSSQVTGKVYAADYAVPTPANLTTAIGNMKTAFTAAAGRAPDVTGLGAGSIGGMALPAGVYRWGTGLLMATSVTLTGSATDVWIFQVAKNLTVSNGAHLVLEGGALPANIFWQVSGDVTLGTTVEFDGTILCQTGISLDTGASITGRLLAQTAVTLDANAVIAPP
jgi:hypothetical protein